MASDSAATDHLAFPAAVGALVEKFRAQEAWYRSPDYNEAQLRQDFLNPFLEALGWDLQNREQLAENQREVIYEDRVKVGSLTKAPDYGFRLAGKRRFFVEAKKPSENIQLSARHAYQLRRYGWSADLPLCILTDFEEFSVYDCRVRPDEADAASIARVMTLRYEDYERRWQDIAGSFSRAAVRDGAFDAFATATKSKRGTETVDKAFLADLESWREQLARHLALRNKQLSVRELNEAVQKLLDRIIFLRICEDRGIEAYGQLQALMNGTGVYARLCELFQRADARFNSGLFHFKEERGRSTAADTWALKLVVDDKPLKEIIRKLYYPASPYEFAVIPPELLGQVYERFLGKVIRLTPSGQAKVEEKPEVRKAGGVFYTPTYIVESIVDHTVGPHLEGKSPADIADLAILDPACGSGSFLLGAYNRLLDWHLDWYTRHKPERHKDQLRKAADNSWTLTTNERKRILLDHLYGVDIDPQAVEVTKLSLLLRVLEGETGETLGGQMRLLQERALPDLEHNIQCGNSLIGPESTLGRQSTFGDLDANAAYRINAFDWKSAFPSVMARGGFDAIIGNPPYIRIQALKEWAPLEVEFYKQRYRSASKGNYDIYVVFVERCLELLSPQGRLGFILPHKFFNAQYGQALREMISAGRHLAEVIHFGDQQVFDQATTYTCLMFLEKAGVPSLHFTKVNDLSAWRRNEAGTTGDIPAERVTPSEWNFVVSKGADLFERLRAMPVKLGDVADRIFQGPITSADTVFLFNEFETGSDLVVVQSRSLDRKVPLEASVLRRVIRSGNIGRYTAKPTMLALFPYQVDDGDATIIQPDEFSALYPRAWDYVTEHRRILSERENGKFQDRYWYRYGRSQNIGRWETRKLMVPYMVSRLAGYLDTSDHFYFINVTTGGYGLSLGESESDYSFVSGLVNSRLLDFYLRCTSSAFHGGYFAANKQYLEQLPIVQCHTDRRSDLSLCSVRMHNLHRDLTAVQSTHDRTLVQRKLDATDREIDRLVYELYDLTPAEIAVVEGRS